MVFKALDNLGKATIGRVVNPKGRYDNGRAPQTKPQRQNSDSYARGTRKSGNGFKLFGFLKPKNARIRRASTQPSNPSNPGTLASHGKGHYQPARVYNDGRTLRPLPNYPVYGGTTWKAENRDGQVWITSGSDNHGATRDRVVNTWSTPSNNGSQNNKLGAQATIASEIGGGQNYYGFLAKYQQLGQASNNGRNRTYSVPVGGGNALFVINDQARTASLVGTGGNISSDQVKYLLDQS